MTWKPLEQLRAERRAEAERRHAEMRLFPPIDPRLIEAMREFWPASQRPPQLSDSDRVIWANVGVADVIDTLTEIHEQQTHNAMN
jgi:hypothetical protein